MLRELIHNRLGVKDSSHEASSPTLLIEAVPDELLRFNSARKTLERFIYQMEPEKQRAVEPLVDWMRSVVLQTSPSMLEDLTE